MDPNLFHLDWERTIEALAGIVVLSFFVERGLALLFESRWWLGRMEEPRLRAAPAKAAGATDTGNQSEKSAAPSSQPGLTYPLKEILAFIVALAVCVIWKFDAVSIVLLSERTNLVGMAVTAAVVAGGSKSSIALFHDVLHVRSGALEELKKLRESEGKM